MKVVQTKLGDVEYLLLREIATKKRSTIKDVVREAVEAYILEEKIDSKDSLFSGPVAKKGAKNGSVKHDKYLYG